MSVIPFTAIEWSSIGMSESRGISGTSYCRSIELPGVRIRLIEYSGDFLADHWCEKGHLVQCLQGRFTLEQGNGVGFAFAEGCGFVVSDGQSSHRLRTTPGGKLLIVDGDFLKDAE
jgi:hypothetical protein